MAAEQKPNGYWNSLENKINEVRVVLVKTRKAPKDLTTDIMKKNGLGRPLSNAGSIYALLKEIGLADFEPWEMRTKVPKGYFKENIENRIRAVRWLVEKTGKNPKELVVQDFYDNGLGGLLCKRHCYSPYFTLKEAGLADFEIWEMKVKVPAEYFKIVENRVRAVKWLVEKTGKDPKNIETQDFVQNGLGGLLNGYFESSSYLALKEAGLAKFELWERSAHTGRYFKIAENRIRAVRWLAEKTGKNPKEITAQEFINNNLRSLLSSHYHSRPYDALKEAGLADFEPWEIKGNVSKGYFKENIENRIRAVKWLVEKTGKAPQGIQLKDFRNNGLGGLLYMYYGNSPFIALKEAGYDAKSKANALSTNAAELLKKYIQR